MSAAWVIGCRRDSSVLDLAAETMRLRIGEQVQDGAQPVLVPGVVLGRPAGHVEPLDVADRHRRLHLVFRLHQDGGEVAVPHAERQRDLVEADAALAHRVARQEGEGDVGVGETVQDGAAPVVAGLDFGGVDPGRVAGGFQVAPDAQHQLGVGVVGVAEEHLQAHAAWWGRRGGKRKEMFAFRFGDGVTSPSWPGSSRPSDRGTLPLQMAGSSPAMTGGWFHAAGRPLPVGVELAMTRGRGTPCNAATHAS